MAAVTARKAITFVAVAIGTFVALVILWFPIHGYRTIGGECSFEEVECRATTPSSSQSAQAPSPEV